MCSQHVKVSLAQAHDELLLSHFQLGLGQGHLLHALFVTGLVGWAIQRVAGAERERTGAESATAQGIALVVQVGLGPVAAQTCRGPQQGLGLLGPGQCGLELRAG